MSPAGHSCEPLSISTVGAHSVEMFMLNVPQIVEALEKYCGTWATEWLIQLVACVW